MTYWVEMSEIGDVRRIKSDLLLMIDRAFADEGIAIPFPQRDVRLSTAQPVPVEIVGSAGMRTAA
jgi:small-conductance mechanosensitive channel